MKNIIDVLQSISTSLFEQFLPFFELENGEILMFSQKFHTSFIIHRDEANTAYFLNCTNENKSAIGLIITNEELQSIELLKPRFVKFLNSASEHQNKLNAKYTKEYIERIKYLSENTDFKKIDKYQEFLFSCGTDNGVLFSIKGVDIYIKIKDMKIQMCVINKSDISYLKRQRILKMLSTLVNTYIFE